MTSSLTSCSHGTGAWEFHVTMALPAQPIVSIDSNLVLCHGITTSFFACPLIKDESKLPQPALLRVGFDYIPTILGALKRFNHPLLNRRRLCGFWTGRTGGWSGRFGRSGR